MQLCVSKGQQILPQTMKIPPTKLNSSPVLQFQYEHLPSAPPRKNYNRLHWVLIGQGYLHTDYMGELN